MLLENIRSCYH